MPRRRAGFAGRITVAAWSLMRAGRSGAQCHRRGHGGVCFGSLHFNWTLHMASVVSWGGLQLSRHKGMADGRRSFPHLLRTSPRKRACAPMAGGFSGKGRAGLRAEDTKPLCLGAKLVAAIISGWPKRYNLQRFACRAVGGRGFLLEIAVFTRR